MTQAGPPPAKQVGFRPTPIESSKPYEPNTQSKEDAMRETIRRLTGEGAKMRDMLQQMVNARATWDYLEGHGANEQGYENACSAFDGLVFYAAQMGILPVIDPDWYDTYGPLDEIDGEE